MSVYMVIVRDLKSWEQVSGTPEDVCRYIVRHWRTVEPLSNLVPLLYVSIMYGFTDEVDTIARSLDLVVSTAPWLTFIEES